MTSNVGVIIVHYRTPDALEECLQRLVALTAPIVIVDTSEEPIARFHMEQWRTRSEPLILLERPDNPGFSAACHAGYRALPSHIPFVLMANADVFITPDAVDRLTSFMHAHPRVGLVGPRLIASDGTIEPSWGYPITFAREILYRWRTRWMHHSLLQRRWRAMRTPRPVGWVSGACMLVRRSAWDETGGLDPQFFLYYEDCDLGLRMWSAGWEVWWVPTVDAVHLRGLSVRGHPSIAPQVQRARRRSQWYYYEKHRPPWERRLLALYFRCRGIPTPPGLERSRGNG